MTSAASPDPASAPLRPQAIVVLPLSDERATPDDAWFVDAVTSDLTALLGQLDKMLVIGAGTARTYQGRTVDTRTVARELGVRYVLRAARGETVNGSAWPCRWRTASRVRSSGLSASSSTAQPWHTRSTTSSGRSRGR